MKKRRRPPQTKSIFNLPGHKQSLEASLEKAESLIAQDHPEEAVDLLHPLVRRYPRDGRLHYMLGYAYASAGNLWESLPHYQAAQRQMRDPELWIPIAALAMELGLKVIALEATRLAVKHKADHPAFSDMAAQLQWLEEEIRLTAQDLQLPVEKAQKGMHLMEEGQIALQQHNYAQTIHLNQQASRLLGQWPPCLNNLSLGQFFHGEPEKAIQTAQRVLTLAPQNIQALSNIIRFLVWTLRKPAAEHYWQQLKVLEPADDTLRLKMVEAAAIMEDDEAVYRLSQIKLPKLLTDLTFQQQERFYLAVAEANLKRPSARRHLRELQPQFSRLKDYLQALADGRPGLGWSARFPYFDGCTLIPQAEFKSFVTLVGQADAMPERKYRQAIDRFVTRFPQIVLIGEKTLLEDQQVEGGIAILSIAATPAAYDALRRFALGQAGPDEARIQALLALLEAGQYPPGAKVTVWRNQQWQEVQLQEYEITPQKERLVAPQIARLLDEGIQVMRDGDFARAESLLRQAIALEPRAAEAYHNLGAIYSHRGDKEQANTLYRQALEIEPLYIHPRCSLALYLLQEDKLAEAEAMIAPLEEVTHFHPQELAFLHYTRANILMAKEKEEEATEMLRMALEIYPEYEPAQAMLKRLEVISQFGSIFESFAQEQRRRNSNRRVRMQQKLNTLSPTLADAVNLYTKELLTAVARNVLSHGGWTGLRKAELQQTLIEFMQEEYVLQTAVSQLDEAARVALGRVVAANGALLWDEFNADFDNDLDESIYWQYHQPETIMGRLRARLLLVETSVDNRLWLAVPLELRQPLQQILDI